MKTLRVRTELQMSHLDKAIKVVCAKVRYDAEYDFDHEGEDEALFLGYR